MTAPRPGPVPPAVLHRRPVGRRRRGATIEVTNPATGETLGTTLKTDAAETRRAIEAAVRR